jgi:hypothetical protein
MIVGNIMEPLENEWSADADNLWHSYFNFLAG